MTGPANEALWRRRFFIVSLVRLSGLGLFLLGLVMLFTDWLLPRGAILPGMVVTGTGLVEMLLGPIYLKRAWKRSDQR